MKRLAVLVVALLTSGAMLATPTTAGAAAPRAFGDVSLNDVVHIAASDAWAVGDGGVASHWDGGSWSSRHLGGLSSPDLNGVDATSTSDVWAVGGVVFQDAFRGFASHWDGSGWHRTPVPAYPGEAILQDVSVSSGTDAYAVGRWFATTPAGQLGGAVIVHWNGSAWRRVAAPLSLSRLAAVTAFGSGRYLGVGASTTGDPVAVTVGPAGGVAVRSLPEPPGVRCTARDVDGPLAIVVGTCRPISGGVPTRPYIVDRRPNGTWRAQIVPGRDSQLWGVDSDDATWAVGRRLTALTLRRRPDGTWFHVATPSLPNDGALFAVGARSFSDAWAVGSHRAGAERRPLALHWDGAAWTAVHVPLA